MNVKNKKVIRIKLKKSIKIIILIFFAIPALFLSVYYLTKSVKTSFKTEDIVMVYKKNSDIDYKVYLLPNNYFSESYLPSGGKYISSIIDNLNTTFSFDFSASRKMDYNYSYKVIGVLEIKQRDNLEGTSLLTKEYEIVPEQKVIWNDKTDFNISQVVNINYQEYNNYVNDFKKDYTLAINANLYLKMIVNINGVIDGYDKPFNNSYNLDLAIPLSEQTINITKQNIGEDSKTIKETLETTIKINYFKVGLFIFLTFISLCSVVYLMIVIANSHKLQRKYELIINKLLNNYDDIIVISANFVDLTNINVIDVISFEELLDAQQELRLPITYFEEIPFEKSCFVIISENQAWRYVVINED